MFTQSCLTLCYSAQPPSSYSALERHTIWSTTSPSSTTCHTVLPSQACCTTAGRNPTCTDPSRWTQQASTICYLLTVHICNSSGFTDFPSCTCCLLQVNLLVPVCYLMFWAVLLGFSLYSEPVVCGVGLVIMLTGVPVYFLGVHWKEKPKCIYNFIGEFLKKLLCRV